MPMPHADMKRLIERRLKGTEGNARLQVIRECMAMLPGYKQGPYADLRKWLQGQVEITRKKRDSRHSEEIFVPRDGDARVVLLGVPNAGKSSLLRALSRSKVEVGDYAFTTVRPIAATAELNQSRIQLVEIPGLIEGARENRGGGRLYLGAAQDADAFLLLMPLEQGGIEDLTLLLEEVGDVIRGRPAIVVGTKRDLFGSEDVLEQIRQCLSDGPSHDHEGAQRRDSMRSRGSIDAGGPALSSLITRLRTAGCSTIVAVSSTTGQGIDELKSAMWQMVGLMRVFAKDDVDRPFIIARGSTVKSLAAFIHNDLADKLIRAAVWGPSAKFPGQIVGKEHVLQDGDRIEIIARR